MQLNYIISALLLTFTTLTLANPTPKDVKLPPGPSPGKKGNVLKKDQIIYPHCTVTVCALYCQYQGRADTEAGLPMICNSPEPIGSFCGAQCSQTATTGRNFHYGNQVDRLAKQKLREGFLKCFKGWQWVKGQMKTC